MGDCWLHPGDVEGRVDTAHCGGEFQADSRGAKDMRNGERPHIPGCKLTCTPSDRDVLGGEPHALTNPVGGSRPPPPVGLLLHPRCGLDQVGACGPPRPLAPPDERYRRGDSHLLLLAREQRGLVTEAALKGRQLRGCRHLAIYGILSPGQLSTPGGRVICTETTQDSLQRLVGPLGLAITLGVETRRETNSGAN